jgi:hypothetical protein
LSHDARTHTASADDGDRRLAALLDLAADGNEAAIADLWSEYRILWRT